MTETPQTFVAATDSFLAEVIERARARVIFVAPGLEPVTAAALEETMRRQDVSLTIILDADPEACRIGYGDADALKTLHDTAAQVRFPLRKEAGLRIGLLLVDDDLVIWSPIARSVDSPRADTQPNGVVLSGGCLAQVQAAVGSDESDVLPSHAEIGQQALTPHELNAVVDDLERNPPAPFDLARRTGVFSSRFQFVEFEIRGAEWTERRIKLSSLLINADLPEHLQEILETQVRPFQAQADVALSVPLLVGGRPAFDRNGKRMHRPHKQADVMKAWGEIRDQYLQQLAGFGRLIRRDKVAEFREAVSTFEETLRAWVSAFREHVQQDESQLVKSIVESIKSRLERAQPRDAKGKLDLEAEVRSGLDRMRVIEPKVRIVLKNVAWESSRDEEFIAAIRRAIPEAELVGWFEEFTAARQRAGDTRG